MSEEVAIPADGTESNTIGEFMFGLNSQEDHVLFTSSLYREVQSIREWGNVDPRLTYYDIADVILDTIASYAGIGAIQATELPVLIKDALEQLTDIEDPDDFLE